LCWSGKRSHALATAISAHLPILLGQSFTPFVSSEIKKGSVWFDELRRALGRSQAGLICLTPENLRSPWIYYEAGAIAGRLGAQGRESAIFTYFLGDEVDLQKTPLEPYQATLANEVETKKLVADVVEAMELHEQADGWEKRYESWWQGLSGELTAIPAPAVAEIVPGFAGLFQRQTFLEPLADCSDQTWLRRYRGAHETAKALDGHRDRVKAACSPEVAALYEQLCSKVGGYTMDLTFLLHEREFEDLDGRLQFDPPGKAAACERRREEINDRVEHLLRRDGAPTPGANFAERSNAAKA
jgi:hypothetical protein